MDQQHYRPRSTSELIDGTIRIVRAHLGTLVPLALVGYLPMIVLFALLPILIQREAAEGTFVVAVLALAVPFVFWFVVFEAAMVHAAGEAYRGRPTSAGASLRFALGPYWQVFFAFLTKYLAPWLTVVAVLLTAVVLPDPLVGLLAIVAAVAAVLIFLRLMLLPATFLFEDNAFGDGVRRSLTLTQGHKWRVFKALLLIYLIWFAIYMVFYIGVSFALLSNPFVAMIIGQIAGSLGYPLFATVTALLYFDFRIRKEAYDIELMSQSISAGAAPSAAT